MSKISINPTLITIFINQDKIPGNIIVDVDYQPAELDTNTAEEITINAVYLECDKDQEYDILNGLSDDVKNEIEEVLIEMRSQFKR